MIVTGSRTESWSENSREGRAGGLEGTGREIYVNSNLSCVTDFTTTELWKQILEHHDPRAQTAGRIATGNSL